MKPLIVLIGVFIISLLLTGWIKRNVDFVLSGRLAMSAMLLFTSIGHFIYSEGMTMMMPSFVPFARQLVWITGIMEICFAVLLLMPRMAAPAGTALIIFFILLLPANVFAALNNVDYIRANHEGPGIRYLFFRVPLQLLFIFWTWYFTKAQLSQISHQI
jgi:uncharacterized membrane protein